MKKTGKVDRILRHKKGSFSSYLLFKLTKKTEKSWPVF